MAFEFRIWPAAVFAAVFLEFIGVFGAGLPTGANVTQILTQ